ncbi:nucleotidyltransferase substrate binding protein [Methanospirillum hungatei]|uniref:nucleotidyltransferase substrate binding protein n=1 Tax=Methanospirillum hungatei TaxID=2203 RepID=UPI0026F0592B|nr:nucleotidyltransferase substrate binding protein [Methanospirillum hungatei]MCA1915792.1 nucleotidyltransferase substrate binding protein [Methanospirillum hungatei]
MLQDIRYKHRLQNYNRVLLMVREGVLSYTSRPLSNMEKQGFIKYFEFTYELAWNLMRDYALYQGHQEIRGSRDAIRLALSMDLISDGETWMDMLESRNITSHTYDENTAEEIMQKIAFRYFPAMAAFQEKMNGIANEG